MADPEAAGRARSVGLEVAAHLITLPQGLHCIQIEAGSPPQDPQTGLPCVQLSVPPGAAGVGIALGGLGVDGWLAPGSAVLARVEVGTRQVVMTVYQAAGQSQAPRLQVTTLATAAPTPPEPPPAPVGIAAHIQGVGDVAGTFGSWIGEPGSGRWMEGFAVTPTMSGIAVEDIEYRAVLGRDWLSPWIAGGQYCGSRGIALPILGLRVRLGGAAAAAHTVQVRASFVGGCIIGPVGAEEACEAPDLAPLEAFWIDVLPVRDPAPSMRRRRPKRG